MIASSFAALTAGLLAAFSPCVLPVLPAVMAGSVGHRLRPLAVVVGMGFTFTLMGGVLTGFRVATGVSGDILRNLFIAVVFFFGVVMASERLVRRFSSATSGLSSFGVIGDESSLMGGLILGAALGVAWIPCTGPVLGPILALAFVQETVLQGTMLLSVYSIGMAIPLIGVAYGGKGVASQFGLVQGRQETLKRVTGWVLILTAIAMALGLDRMLQTALLPYFSWLEV